MVKFGISNFEKCKYLIRRFYPDNVKLAEIEILPELWSKMGLKSPNKGPDYGNLLRTCYMLLYVVMVLGIWLN